MNRSEGGYTLVEVVVVVVFVAALLVALGQVFLFFALGFELLDFIRGLDK